MNIIKEQAQEAWIEALETLIALGQDVTDATGRKTKELLGMRIEVTQREGIEEPVRTLRDFKRWVYPTLDEIAAIMLTKKYSPTYDYSYGGLLFNYNGINQIDDIIIPMLRKTPMSRRSIATLWDPSKVEQNPGGVAPGLIAIDFKIRDNKLHLTAFIRSSDMFFGWPANLYQLSVLQQYVQQKIGCDRGSIITYSTSAHLFDDQLADVRSVVEKRF